MSNIPNNTFNVVETLANVRSSLNEATCKCDDRVVIAELDSIVNSITDIIHSLHCYDCDTFVDELSDVNNRLIHLLREMRGTCNSYPTEYVYSVLDALDGLCT